MIMSRKAYFLFAMLLILLTVISCGGQSENVAAATTAPTSTHTAEPEPTNTNTATRPQPTRTNTATSTTVPSATFTLLPSNTPAPSGQVTTAVSLRSQPDATSSSVATLNTGTTVEIIAITEDSQWYQVRTDSGREGWLLADKFQVITLPLLTRIPRVTLAPTNTAEPATFTPRPQPTNTRPLIINTPTLAPVTSTSLPPTQPPPTLAPPTDTPPPVAVCNCSGDLYNCSDFSTHAAAQSCFNYCVAQGVGDIHGLDRDGDGDACESLP